MVLLMLNVALFGIRSDFDTVRGLNYVNEVDLAELLGPGDDRHPHRWETRIAEDLVALARGGEPETNDQLETALEAELWELVAEEDARPTAEEAAELVVARGGEATVRQAARVHVDALGLVVDWALGRRERPRRLEVEVAELPRGHVVALAGEEDDFGGQIGWLLYGFLRGHPSGVAETCGIRFGKSLAEVMNG